MGGILKTSGTTPLAEFNLQCDPEAARAVFQAGFRLTVVPLDLARGPARLTPADMSLIAARQSAPARLVRALLAYGGQVASRRGASPGGSGVACPDAVAMAVALDRTLLTHSVTAAVDVETRGESTAGMMVVERSTGSGRAPNAVVGLGLDAVRFKAALVQIITRELTLPESPERGTAGAAAASPDL